MTVKLRRRTTSRRPTLVVCLLALAGCGGRSGEGSDPGEAGRLLVLAAASLNAAMPELIDAFQQGTGAEVDLVLGASGSLAAQIESGAPADVFFSADEATVERLRAAGHLDTTTVRRYASGQLVVIWSEGTAPIGAPEELDREDLEVIAIANPALAPYGAAAIQVLRRAGVVDAVQPRLVFGENIAQTYQLVRTRNADAALIARSILTDETAAEFTPIDPSLHTPLMQAAAVLSRSTHPAARDFLEYVLSPEGQAVLGKYGLALVSETHH